MNLNLLRNRPVRAVINIDFDGDRESAIEAATVLAKTVAPEKLPAWVYELSTTRPVRPGRRHIPRLSARGCEL